LKPSTWAAKHAYVSRSNAEGGKWNPQRMPYQPAMLDDAVDPEVLETVWVMAAQIGKTFVIVQIVLFFIDHEPTGILVVYPTLDSAKAFMREKFGETLEETPRLKGKIAPPRSRNSKNTILNKGYPGGHLTAAGANSAKTLRQRNKRVVIQDEVDSYEVNTEGDPSAQADKRAETFFNAVKIKSSTPTLRGLSRVEAKFEQSDKQYFFCPCPKCNHYQHLRWAQVKWPEGKPEEAVYECAACAARLSDAERIGMIARGEWRATAPFAGIRGRHLNGLYRTIGLKQGNKSYLHEFVKDFLEAKGNQFTLMVWINTFLAETWAEANERVATDPLVKRREEYGPTLPKQVLVITAGVDIQGDRAEINVTGWGDQEESWGVQYKILPGNPLSPDLWRDLDAYLENSTWTTRDGRQLKILATCVDSGFPTTHVYEYTKPRFARRIFSTKGYGQRGQPILIRLTRANRRRCPVYHIGADTAKRTIYGRLLLEKPGPAFMHFPKDPAAGYDENFFAMLTAEEIATRHYKGMPQSFFVLPEGRRNEALDNTVLAYAALAILQPNWKALKDVAGEGKTEESGAGAVSPTSPAAQGQRSRPKFWNARRTPGGFVGGWRRR
jgi:phage terminase large subunit GpA-like protein